jgi:hypothetical protein
MTIEQIRERLAEGVDPFVLRLSDGRKVEVPHPDFIAVGRGGRQRGDRRGRKGSFEED